MKKITIQRNKEIAQLEREIFIDECNLIVLRRYLKVAESDQDNNGNQSDQE